MSVFGTIAENSTTTQGSIRVLWELTTCQCNQIKVDYSHGHQLS